MVQAKGREFTLRRTVQYTLGLALAASQSHTNTNSKNGSNNTSCAASPSTTPNTHNPNPNSPMDLFDDARSTGSSVVSIGGTSRIKGWLGLTMGLGLGSGNSGTGTQLEYTKDLQFRCDDAKVILGVCLLVYW